MLYFNLAASAMRYSRWTTDIPCRLYKRSVSLWAVLTGSSRANNFLRIHLTTYWITCPRCVHKRRSAPLFYSCQRINDHIQAFSDLMYIYGHHSWVSLSCHHHHHCRWLELMNERFKRISWVQVVLRLLFSSTYRNDSCAQFSSRDKYL